MIKLLDLPFEMLERIASCVVIAENDGRYGQRRSSLRLRLINRIFEAAFLPASSGTWRRTSTAQKSGPSFRCSGTWRPLRRGFRWGSILSLSRFTACKRDAAYQGNLAICPSCPPSRVYGASRFINAASDFRKLCPTTSSCIHSPCYQSTVAMPGALRRWSWR